MKIKRPWSFLAILITGFVFLFTFGATQPRIAISPNIKLIPISHTETGQDNPPRVPPPDRGAHDSLKVDLTADSFHMDFEGFSLTGSLSGKDLLSSSGQLWFIFKSEESARASIDHLRTLLPNLKAGYSPSPSGAGKKFTVVAPSPLGAPENWERFWKTGDGPVRFSIKQAQLSIDGVTVPVSHLDLRGTRTSQGFVHEFKGTVAEGVLSEKGNLRITRGLSRRTVTLLDAKIGLEGFNLGRLVFKKKKKPTKTRGLISGGFKINGPLGSDPEHKKRFQWDGSLTGSGLVVKEDGSTYKAETGNVSFHDGTRESFNAQVYLDQIRTKKILFPKASGRVTATPDRIHLEDGVLSPPTGIIDLSGNYRPKTKFYELKIDGKDLRAEELVENLSGAGDFSGTFHGHLPQDGESPSGKRKLKPKWENGLSGLLNVNLRNGRVDELGSLDVLLGLLNPAEKRSKRRSGLDYDYMGGDVKITDGVAFTDNLRLDANKLKLSAVGKAYLGKEKLNAKLQAIHDNPLGQFVKGIPWLEPYIGGRRDGTLVTHFKVKGPFKNPKVSLLKNQSFRRHPS